MGLVETPVVLVAAGMLVIGVVALALGHRRVVHTAPLISVMPSYNADVSTVTNEISTIHAITDMRKRYTTAPSSPS